MQLSSPLNASRSAVRKSCPSLERIFLFAELPVPALGDLSEVTLLAQRLHRGNPAKLNHTYSDICNLDTIEVNLVPEKKGIFLKHVEYQVTSKVLPELAFPSVKARKERVALLFRRSP